MESTPSAAETDTNVKSCLEHSELKSCDRCLLHCSRLFWNNKEEKKKKLKDDHQEEPGTSQDCFITAGQLLETGPSGKFIFNLSQQLSRAPSLAPKRRHHVLGQSWRAIQLIDSEIENLRPHIFQILLQKINNRQQGILQGSSDEFTDAVASISHKYRNRRDEVNANCFSQMEHLRRQLHADIDFEEKHADHKIKEAFARRLKEVEDKLKQLGCTGPGFSIPLSNVDIQQSSLYRIEFDNKYGTSMLPLPTNLVECVKQAEKDELQNFILYARMASRSEDESPDVKKKRFKMEQVAVTGLMDELADESGDENE